MIYFDPIKLDVHDDPILTLAAAILWRSIQDVVEFGNPPDVREFFNSAWYEIITGSLGLDSHDILNRVSALPARAFRCYPRNESP
jgi:hypothetical protein